MELKITHGSTPYSEIILNAPGPEAERAEWLQRVRAYLWSYGLMATWSTNDYGWIYIAGIGVPCEGQRLRCWHDGRCGRWTTFR